MSQSPSSPGAPGSAQTHRAPRNKLFDAWGRFVVHHRWIVLAAVLALTAMFAYQTATSLRMDVTSKGFLGRENVAVVALDELESTFGSDSILQLVVAGDVFTPTYLDRLKALHDELAELDVELDAEPDLAEVAPKSAAADTPPGEESGTAPGDPAAGGASTAPDDGFGDFGDDGFGDFGEEGEASGGEAGSGDEGAAPKDAWGAERGGTVVDELISLINVRQTRWVNDGLLVDGLLDTWPTAAELPALRERVLGDRTLLGQVVGAAGQHSVVIVRMQAMSEQNRNKVFAAVRDLTATHQTDGFAIHLAGPAALDASMFEIMLTDFRRQLGLGMGLMLLILIFLYRHPLGVIGPLFVVAQSAIWTLGMMALVGKPMTFISNILPLFILCVGMGDSVHIQSVYRDRRREGVANKDAIIEAIATTGVPIFYTTVTTALGLLSFQFASLGAVSDMGAFGAFGVLAALVLSVTLLPVVLTFNTRSLLGNKPHSADAAGAPRRDFLDRFLAACNGLSLGATAAAAAKRRHTVLAVGTALMALAIFGATLLGVHHDPLEWIPDHYPVKQAFTTLDENVGGASAIALLVEPTSPAGLKDRELMLALEALEQDVAAYRHLELDGSERPIVGNSTSVVDVIRESHRAVRGGSAEQYKVADTPQGVVDMFTLFESSAPEQLKRLATIDLSRGLMTIRVRWLEASSYGPLVDHVNAAVERNIGDKAKVTNTGAVFTFFSVIGALITDLLRSFSVAFVVITFIMVLLLASVKLGLIAMIPNLMPIVAVMGIMGLTGIPIDGANLMLASIAIGIAVDDTIHMLHQFWRHYCLHGLVDAALEHSFSHTGRAIVSTSLVLIGGFAVFTVSEMTNIRNFGLLTGLAIMLALLIDLLFLPALLRTFFKDRPAAA